MWVTIFILVVLVAIVVAVMSGEKGTPQRKYTDDELRAMSIDERRSLFENEVKKLKNLNLRILVRQLEDLKHRIETGHKETVEGLSSQDRQRCLERFEIARQELQRRGGE